MNNCFCYIKLSILLLDNDTNIIVYRKWLEL